MKSHALVFAIVAFAFIWVLVGYTQQGAEQLFQSGIYKEEVQGELDAAIKIYETIIKEYPDNRSVAAKALLHTGLCYEKLGQNEAQKAYQRLVNNFPDQKQEVAVARERLSRLKIIAGEVTKTPLTPKFTKIKIPTELGGSVKLSPDGQELALVSDKKLWKMPLTGNLGPEFPGTPVQLNTEGLEVEWSGLSWSGDGNWIAFNEYPQKDEEGKIIENQGIYLVPSGGGKPKKIVENFRDVRTVNYRISLSPNGKKLAYSSVENNEQYIYTIAVEGDNPKQLIDRQAREPVFSPDGKMIAYVEDKDIGKYEGDQGLWIIRAEGGTPHLIAEAGKASSPVWSPDGKMIAFLDYTRNKEINIIPVSIDGEAAGKVTTIDVPEGIEEVDLLAGWTPDKKIGALLRTDQEYALYTLPATGGQAAIVLNDCFALQPRWAPDGKQIFYTTLPAEGNNKFYRMTLASVSSKGGSGKFLPQAPGGKRLKPFGGQGGNRISPDGKTIITAAWCTDDTLANINYPGSHIWKISIDGTEQTKLTAIDGPYVDQSPSWSPDGKEVAFVRKELNESPMDRFGESSIYTVSSSGGVPNLLIAESDKWIISPVWSPDGKMIAYLTQEKDVPETKALNVINVNSGKSRIVGEVPAVHINIELAWSPDSKRIAYNDKEGEVIKIMSLSDGSIEDIKTNLVDVTIYHLDWSPDGERFVFGGCEGGNNEFWFLEDFLPLDKLQTKSDIEKSKTKALTDKKIWEGQDIDDSGEISPDGKYLSYIDWNIGELAVYEIATGKKRRLTYNNSSADYDEFAFSPKWMADSKHIVYTAFISRELSELRMIGLEDSKPRTIYSLRGKEKWLEVHDISKDGKTILTSIEIEGDTTQIALLSIPDGKLRIIKELPAQFAENLEFTNNDNGIIYDYPPNLASPNHDIYLLSIDGKSETPIIKHPANDYVLGLSPDGKQLLFASSRSGQLGFWSIRLEGGKTQGNPKYIKASEYPYLKGLSFTENGSFFYCYYPANTDVYETEINPELGKIVIPPHEIVGNFIGENSTPDCSSDGKYLAFVSRRSPFNSRETFIPRGNILCIKSLENGNVREIKPDISNFGFPKWSPDNRSILVVNWDADKKMGIYKIDVQTGKLSLIVRDENRKIHHHDWSSDGKSIFLVRNAANDSLKLVKHSLITGEETILITASWKELQTISCSPDGKWLAFLGRDKKRTLKIVQSSGGEIREIHTWNQGDNRTIRHCWSADGKYIYLQKLREPKKDLIWNLWQIPVEGGEPKNLGLEMTDIWQISAHPDGRHIVFSNQGETYKLPQVWMMENFLPQPKTDQ